MSKTTVRKPIEVKISTVVAVAAILREADLATLSAALQELTGGEADYFDDEFTIIDLAGLEGLEAQPASIDWAALVQLFRSHRLNPIAVRNAPQAMQAAILAQGLSLDVMPAPRAAQPEPAPEPVRRPEPAAAPVPTAQPATGAPTLIIDTPVRGGQRIYAQGCDLVVTAVVNAGAEIIADGSIHVYAPLRGRALAGAGGNAQARIFTTSMEAELVSIAGFYRTFEDGLPKGVAKKPVQVRLDGESIAIAVLADRGR